MTPQEETLQLALQDFGLRELPPEWHPNGDTTLVDGIALVVKATGKEYCKVADVNGKISVVRDYGQCAMIISTEKIFAVNTMTKFDIPQFKSDAEIIHYLSKSKYDKAEIEALLKAGDREEIQRRINNLTISAQKRKIAERKRVDEIKEFAEKTRVEKEKAKSNGRRKKKENNG